MPIELQKDGSYKMTETEEKAIREDMEREYNNALTVTQDIRKRWWLVERYLEGNQWSSASEGGWTFLSVANNAMLNMNAMEVNVDENVVVDNLMLRIHMTNVARLCRYKPQLEIAPNEKSKEQNVAVRKGRVALYDLLQKSNWIRLQQTHARHLNVMGITFLKVAYDPSAGKQVKWPVLDPNTGQVAVDAEGKPLFKQKPEGEVKLNAVNPKNLQFPMNCTSLLDADWVQESNLRSVSYVKRVYGVVVAAEAVTAFERERAGMGNSDLKASAEEVKSDSVIVKERWYRPCEKYPEGAIIVWTKEKLLVSKSLLKWYPDIPYFCAWNVFNDESVYADCPAYHLVQHQNEVNRTESNIARHVNLVGKPKLLLNRDTGVSDKAFTTDTGEIVEWSGQQPPSWLLAPPVSQSLYEHVNRHVDRMMVIGYAQDIQRPSHSRSGNAIAYEQEIDENTMGPMVASMTDMLERGLSFGLQLMARYYKVPRMMKMLDSNRWVIEREFKGSDLFGNFDVRVNFLAGLPANKLAKQQFVIQMFQKGLLAKPLAQKYLELGEAEDALREQAMEAEVVDAGIKAMERGFTVPPHEWDNHALWVMMLETWLRENALDANPKMLQQAEEKLAWHKEYMALKQHPANAGDGGAPEMGPGGVPRGTDGGGAPGQDDLEVSPTPEELGGAPSVQEGDAQPSPEMVLQSGPEGV
jgi:hypothetical protein